MEIIPAIDIINGECVRLSKGDYSKKVIYNSSPKETAENFYREGFRRLHVVDLDGAKIGAPCNLELLEEIKGGFPAHIEYGGGLATFGDIAKAFELGADSVVLGSLAVKESELFEYLLSLYGPDKIILGVDVRGGYVAVSGWLEQTGISLDSLLESYFAKGLKRVICTDIDKDGMLSGANIDLYKNLVNRYPGIHFTMSGGVSSINDITNAKISGVSSVIVGKAIYEGVIDIKELSLWLQNE